VAWAVSLIRPLVARGALDAVVPMLAGGTFKTESTPLEDLLKTIPGYDEDAED
jgi:hypothetical protein